MSQEYSEKGGIKWAIRSYGESRAALEREELDTAMATPKESFIAFPFPKIIELLGERLLLENSLPEEHV